MKIIDLLYQLDMDTIVTIKAKDTDYYLCTPLSYKNIPTNILNANVLVMRAKETDNVEIHTVYATE